MLANRVADETIYNNFDFYETPKEYFSLVLDAIQNELTSPASVLDIGCANGAFLNHVNKKFPGSILNGIEPISALADIARENLVNANISCGDLFNIDSIKQVQCSPAVSLLGVMGIFFDPSKVVERLLEVTDNGGAVFIFSPFNEEPVDVILNYRHAPDGEWESGHNLFSMQTMESICSSLGVSFRWVDFSMSRSIPKHNDPMRSWTEPFRGKDHHLIYGTNMFSTMKLLVIRK